MDAQPLFVIGSPRSGTTFLCNVLNKHPLIHLSNESRLFVLLKDMADLRARYPDLLEPEHRARMASFVRRKAGKWAEEFYREELGIKAPIWGDKHPPYADPQVLTAYSRRIPGKPQLGSCLRFIQDCLPNAKFIHIHRDPRQVAHSILRKGWAPSLEAAVSAWRRYIEEIEGFFAEIGAASQLTLSLSDLYNRPAFPLAAICDFLGLSSAGPMEDFLAAQQLAPTPFSDPVTDLADRSRLRLDVSDNLRALALAGHHAERLGYITADAAD